MKRLCVRFLCRVHRFTSGTPNFALFPFPASYIPGSMPKSSFSHRAHEASCVPLFTSTSDYQGPLLLCLSISAVSCIPTTRLIFTLVIELCTLLLGIFDPYTAPTLTSAFRLRRPFILYNRSVARARCADR